jgi:hypothetical protein
MQFGEAAKAMFQFPELILISAQQIVFFSFTLALDYGSCLTRVIIPLLFQWHSELDDIIYPLYIARRSKAFTA